MDEGQSHRRYEVKRIALSLLMLFALAAAASAQTTSLLDPSRLSVGARVYRSFDEKPGIAGSYSSAWWAGIPLAWEITSPKDAAVKLPISIIGAVDLGIPVGGQATTVRGYVGVVFLLKKAGQ
jgi:hypothetical protein